MNEKNIRPLVLYHQYCSDGFAAALAAWLCFKDEADYIGCTYERALEVDVKDRDVYILDFSFPLPLMQTFGEQARQLVLLDHHKSAQQSLGRFKPICCGKIHFDLGKSGAALAWEHFHPGKPMPYLFDCVQSRDLWRWNVAGDREFLTWLDTLPFVFEEWAAVLQATEQELGSYRQIGAAMLRKQDSLVQSIAKRAMPVELDGQRGLMVNGPSEVVSELGEALAKKSGTFGLVWHVLPTGTVKCSLRSVASFDAMSLAQRFGGGGHPQAASFHTAVQKLPQLLSGALSA